jgi:hypothetical protein
MAKLTAKVVKIEPRRGQSGSYAIAHLEGGKRAYVWDRALAQSLATPGVYELETQVRQGYLRIVAARPIASTNGAQGHVQVQEERPPEASTTPGAPQERMVALQAAVALAPHFGYTDVSQVLSVASRLLRWLRRGEA